MKEALPDPGTSALGQWRKVQDQDKAILDEIRASHEAMLTPIVEVSLSRFRTFQSHDQVVAYLMKLEELAHELVVALLAEIDPATEDKYDTEDVSRFVGLITENPHAEVATKNAVWSLSRQGVIQENEDGTLSLINPYATDIITTTEYESL